MLELIQVTAQYSNAVLVALLPQISDFARKAELPIPTPITAQDVAKFACSPLKYEVGGAVTLKNGLWVSYLQGHVYDFRTPRSYYSLQDPRNIPKFFGSVNLGKDAALQFARAAIRKLGYSLKDTFTDQEPEIDMPLTIGTNVIPYYRFRWKDPVYGKTAVRIELNAQSKRIEEMRFASPFFWRAPPKIAIQPATLGREVPISASVSNEFLAVSLPQFQDFSKKMRLPFQSSLAVRQVKTVKFFDAGSNGWVKLSNGYSFIFENGAITEFSTPSSIYGFRPNPMEKYPARFSSYLGKWKMSAEDAANLVRQAMSSLGYNPRDFNMDKPPDIKTNSPVGKYLVPRFHFSWATGNPAAGKTVSLVLAEVNADAKQLEHLQLFHGPVNADTGLLGSNLGKNLVSTNIPNERAMDAQMLEFLERNMLPATNVVRTNPAVRRPNPYE